MYVILSNSSSSNPDMTKADMARSLLYLVSNDIGQISTLYAMLHNVKNIYFGGFFLRHHPVSLHTISYAVNYWSKGKNCISIRTYNEILFTIQIAIYKIYKSYYIN